MIDWREAAHNRVILGVLVLTLMIDNRLGVDGLGSPSQTGMVVCVDNVVQM